MFLRIGNCNDIKPGRSGLGLPHALNGSELHLLAFGGGVAGFVTQHDHRQRRAKAKCRRHSHRPLGKINIALIEQEKGAHAQHEHRAGNIACADGVDEFRLGGRIEQHIVEVGDFHTHGLEVERGADGVLHPAIGYQNPQRRQIRTQRHHPGDKQVRSSRQPVPAKKENTDEGRFKKEGHQTFNRQWGTEDVADIVRVVCPVRPKLELHG